MATRDERGRFVKLPSGPAAAAGDGFTFKVLGAKELERRLRQLPVQVQKKVIRQGLRKGAKVILARVKANAPGSIKRAVKVKAGKRTRKGTIRVNVQIGQGAYKGETFYGAFPEYGTKRAGTGTPGKTRSPGQPAQHYMKRGFEQSEPQARAVILDDFRAGIEREAKQG